MQRFTHVMLAALLILLGSSTANAQGQWITVTLAGNGTPGYTGDGGSGKLSQISGPKDVCMDAAQNIYFVDKANGRIRKISAQKGIITTLAGGGSSTMDGVPATTASLSPNYLCISASGNLYFTNGNEIKKIDAATGIITTVAGNTTAGYTGDGGLAAVATLSNPQGIAIDAANNIYVVDRGNNCIRKITASTGIIKTIAGNGAPGSAGDGGPATAALLHGPVCVCVNAAGDVFFSDQNPSYPSYDNSVIRKIAASTGIVTRIAGATGTALGTCNVPALSATLGTITGMCISPSGALYCCEMSCSCRMINFITDTLYLVGGNFSIQGYSDDITSPLANMNIPYGLCVDSRGAVYVADSNNQRIRKIVQLSHTPSFAFGRGQYMNPIAATPYVLDSMMRITDLDSGQLETWTVITPPAHGTLSGFPATATSYGNITTAKATGLSYTPSSSYAGADLFRIRVSDGSLSDTVIVYVGPNSSATTLSVSNPQSISYVTIFPNPAASILNIAWVNLQSDDANITITDISDRIVYTSKADAKAGAAQVNISSLPSGIYLVRVNDLEVKKFIKQ